MIGMREAAVVPVIGALLSLLSSCAGGDGGGVVFSDITLERAYPGLTFSQPVALVHPPGDDSRWFVLEKAGRLYMFANNASAATATLSADLAARVDAAGEGGLLGMAFHPSFSGSGDVFLSYTSPDPSVPFVSRISRFTMNMGGIIDTTAESVVLSVDQPFTNHNGGHIAFGPDGFLYIGMGDGGGGGDPGGNGQDTTTLLGAMLRIDVDNKDPGLEYAVPIDNPFFGSGTDAGEIFAWGFRNPWRWSFDRGSGDLWLGDVGQGSWEEVDLVVSGGNYGWNVEEGNHCYPPGSVCDDAGLTDPVAEYDHSEGRSITGGYVYRGTALADRQGTYFFGDYVNGRLWGIDTSLSQPDVVLLEETGLNIASFAEDSDGELYLIDFSGGGIHRIVPAPP